MRPAAFAREGRERRERWWSAMVQLYAITNLPRAAYAVEEVESHCVHEYVRALCVAGFARSQHESCRSRSAARQHVLDLGCPASMGEVVCELCHARWRL